MEHLQYPIGKFIPGLPHSRENVYSFIENIKALPQALKEHTQNLTQKELQKTYRQGGWNVKQIIHHLGESHINCYVRIKLALTENNPIIKPYDENLWVNTKENELLSHHVSLNLLEVIHLKIVCLAQNLSDEELKRTYVHPQYQRTSPINDVLALYSWHGNHHLAHIKLALGLAVN
jgi:exoribonuclease II